MEFRLATDTSSCSGLQTVFLIEHRPRIRGDSNLHLDANESIVVDTGGDDTIDGIEPSTGTVAAVSDDEEDE